LSQIVAICRKKRPRSMCLEFHPSKSNKDIAKSERPRLTFSSRYVRLNSHACGTPSRGTERTHYGDT
jgi:hypothetical protein